MALQEKITDDMFINGKSNGVRDIEAGSISRHVTNTDRKASSIEASLEIKADGGNIEWNDFGIDKWVGSLERILQDVPQYMCTRGHPGRICRIPQNLREIDINAYEPYFLSVGPYHHGKPKLQHMEKRKHAVLKSFLNQRPDLTLKDYLKEVKSIESEARRFYSDIDMDSEKFVHMLLFDSLFILTVFCGMVETGDGMEQTNSVDNEELNKRLNQISGGIVTEDYDKEAQIMSGEEYGDGYKWFLALFAHDIFLLENQLPLFVLEKIHNFAYGSSRVQLIRMMNDKVGNLLLNYTKPESEVVIEPTEEVHHLLHLCHLFFRPKLQKESNNCQIYENNQVFRLGSAVQLYEAGVRFEARSAATEHSLLDITFDRSGIITMPCLCVDENTDSLLRNLIALEQMKYPDLGLHVSAYAVLLLHLVTVPEDVELLSRKGIIDHHLASDKEMMYLVNRLSVGLSFDYGEDKYSLKPVFQELKRYTEHRVPRWRAWLTHRYFNNPWTVISLLAASLLLLLSFVQTYYTVYSYYYPCFDCHS